MMDAKKLIEPAKDWTGDRWLDRVDRAASLLFVHGYITETQRAKVTKKLEQAMIKGIDDGSIAPVNEFAQ